MLFWSRANIDYYGCKQFKPLLAPNWFRHANYEFDKLIAYAFLRTCILLSAIMDVLENRYVTANEYEILKTTFDSAFLSGMTIASNPKDRCLI